MENPSVKFPNPVRLQLFRLLCLLLATFFVVQLSGLSAQVVAISGVDYFRELFTPVINPLSLVFWLSLAVIIGAWCGFLAVKSRHSAARVAVFHLFIYLALRLGFWIASSLTATGEGEPRSDFLVASYWESVSLVLFTYAITFISTWCFWIWRGWAFIEAAVFAITLGLFLRGHQNYQLDAPKELSSLAWQLHLDAEYIFLGIGFIFTSLVVLFFLFSSNRKLYRNANPVFVNNRKQTISGLLAYVMVLVVLVLTSALVLRFYDSKRALGSEGVGTSPQKEGESNLSFSSAVTKTRHPAALLRLEGDYKKNPWTPMLYLREGALSNYNGLELVVSAPGLDSDVPRIRPGEPFIELAKPTTDAERIRVIQSIFLLAKHASPFAIDFPQSIRTLKNPDPQRFLLGYQAISSAPTVKLEDLIGEEVGDPTWGDREKENYLRAPGSRSTSAVDQEIIHRLTPVLDGFNEDLRYKAFSNLLTKDAVTPIEKAQQIINYLSKESIYTRTPGHQVTAGGDPVAPYLFAEKKRGYCVHFSHAAVYLLRLAGIPARIGTGYLTDLTYAKDGHVLLQLGDRHAWPEIYVRGHGWVIADIQPAQAENEPSLVPDEKLLDELMSKLEPSDPLLADTKADPENSSHEEEQLLNQVRITSFFAALAFAALLFVTLKLWLRFSWILPAPSTTRTRRAYLAFASRLADLGHFRDYGETRVEFAKRTKAELGIEGQAITHLLEQVRFSQHGDSIVATEITAAVAKTERRSRSLGGRVVEFIAFFSPLSLRRIFRW